MRRSQISVAVLVLVALGWLASALVGRRPGWIAGAAVFLLLALAFGWWSLRRGNHIGLAQARERTQHGGAIVLWKPGCLYCERLMRALRGRRDIAWVNVWADPEANRFVRELNGGDELTPTAVIGARVLRNPTADELAAAVDDRASLAE